MLLYISAVYLLRIFDRNPRRSFCLLRNSDKGNGYSVEVEVEVEVEVNLRSTVSRSVCLGVGLPSGAHNKIFVFSLITAGFLMRGTLFDENMGL
jgi:hypothetical protein